MLGEIRYNSWDKENKNVFKFNIIIYESERKVETERQIENQTERQTITEI